MQLNFILCPSYHGATLLSLLLNNHSRISSLGDTLPPRKPDVTCACGEKVSKCEFWIKIEERLHTDNYANLDRLLPWYPILVRNPSRNTKINRIIEKAVFAGLPASLAIRSIWRNAKVFNDISIEFSRTVCDIAGTDLFIDSKKPMISVIVQSILDKAKNLKVLHIVRDPRGFAFSSKKHKKSVSLDQICKNWTMYHRNTIKLNSILNEVNILTVRHEDLCDDPETTMRKIFKHFGVGYENVFCPPINPLKHHLIGNRGTLERFDGEVRCDDTWRTTLSKEEQKEILELTYPLSDKYGYYLSETNLQS